MILVILAICIVLLVIGAVFYIRDWSNDVACFTAIFGGITSIVALIALICLSVDVTNLNVIDDKIAMYQEENTKIEEQISAAVESYQKYETDIFTEVNGEEAISLVALYPDLKADTLVQKQIEVYLANNEKIKELKESQINGSVKRWWLYFGGNNNE